MEYIKTHGFASQAIFSNGVAILLLISLLLNYGKKNKNTKIEYKIFNWMLIFNAIQCFVELSTVILDGMLFPGARVVSIVLNTVLFICTLVFVVFWVFFAYYRHNIFVLKPSKAFLLLFIPAAIHFVLILVNIFTPVFFSISQENLYQRGGVFYYLAFADTYFYLTVGAIISYSPNRNQNKYVFIPALTFLFPVLVASLLQFFMPGISLIWVGTAIGLVSVYLSLMDESIAIDALSEIFSRGYLNNYLDKLSKRTDVENRFVGIMMDIDKFKEANDNYGHVVGDKIINSFGKVLKEAIGKNSVAFRYAGDEFVVISQFCDVSEIIEIIGNIKKGVEKSLSSEFFPEDVTFSVGYAIYRKGETADSFLNRMDAQMYVNKNKKKTDTAAN